MLKRIKKKREQTRVGQGGDSVVENTGAIVCGHCRYVRKATDTNPDWQCPCCQSAYAKVNKKHEKKAGPKSPILTRFKQGELEREKLKKTFEIKQKLSLAGIYSGFTAFISGAGVQSACRTVAANPVIQTVGAAVAIGSLGYLVWELFRIL